MEFMQAIDELAEKLKELARKHDRYYAFDMDPKMEELIVGYVKLMREERGIERPESYRRFLQGAAIAFEEAHPNTMWKMFYHGGKPVGGYTLYGEFAGEEESSIRLHAAELGCDPSEIMVEYEQR